MVGFALSSFFVLFGLLLGLIAVATYQNYSNVSDIVDKEASSIGSLYRDFTGYPQPIRSQLQDRLREYARFTIEDGWPQQRKGIVPDGRNRPHNRALPSVGRLRADQEKRGDFSRRSPAGV